MKMAGQQRKRSRQAVTGFRRDTSGARNAGTFLRRVPQPGTLGEVLEGERTPAQSKFLEDFAAELAKGAEGDQDGA